MIAVDFAEMVQDELVSLIREKYDGDYGDDVMPEYALECHLKDAARRLAAMLMKDAE